MIKKLLCESSTCYVFEDVEDGDQDKVKALTMFQYHNHVSYCIQEGSFDAIVKLMATTNLVCIDEQIADRVLIIHYDNPTTDAQDRSAKHRKLINSRNHPSEFVIRGC